MSATYWLFNFVPMITARESVGTERNQRKQMNNDKVYEKVKGELFGNDAIQFLIQRNPLEQ